MALNHSDKGAIIFMGGLCGLPISLLMVLYIKYLLDHNMLTWKHFIHTHWIGVAGIIGLVAFLISALLCIYLTLKDVNVGREASS